MSGAWAAVVVNYEAGDALTECVRSLRADDSVGAVGPCVRNLDGTVYPSARRDPGLVDATGHAVFGSVWPRNPFTRRYRELGADPAVARDVDWASGPALWLRRTAVDAIGGWDEGFFMYLEVVHVQGLSTDRHRSRMIIEHHRSMFRFASKRWKGRRRLLLLPTAALLAVRALFTVAWDGLRPRRSGPEITR